MTRILVALGALAICAVASAQYTDQPTDLGNASVGFSFRVGGYFPADSKLRDVESVFWDAGVEYELEKSLFKGSTTYVAGDWISNTLLGGQHVGNLSINERFYTKNRRFAEGGTPYFFVGVGSELTHVAGSNSTTWLVRGGIGTEFQGNYFVEIGGNVSPKVAGINPSGASLSVGYRFRD